MKWICSDCRGQMGVPAHSSLWVWKLAEGPELLKKDGWSPGGDLFLGRHQDQLRRTWAPCHLRPSSSSFPSAPCLRARSRRDVPLQRYPRQPQPYYLWLFFWTSNAWRGLPQNPDGTEQRLHCWDGPWSDTAPTTLSAAPRRCWSHGWSIWKVTRTFWPGEDGQRLARSAYMMWSCHGAVSAVLGWIKCPREEVDHWRHWWPVFVIAELINVSKPLLG